RLCHRKTGDVTTCGSLLFTSKRSFTDRQRKRMKFSWNFEFPDAAGRKRGGEVPPERKKWSVLKNLFLQ
ncbi:unnamed protein product, partial [Larinioides sclopetarius]